MNCALWTALVLTRKQQLANHKEHSAAEPQPKPRNTRNTRKEGHNPFRFPRIRRIPESAKQSLVVVVKCNELIMIEGRESCSCVQSVAGQPAAPKLGKAKMRAVASANSVQPRYAKVRVASLSKMVKPALEGKTRPRAPFKLSGVRGDSAHRNNHQELGRPCLIFSLAAGGRTLGSHNQRAVRDRESDGLVVAANFRSSREGAKEPWPESS